MPVPPRLRRLLTAALPAIAAVAFTACSASYPNSIFHRNTDFDEFLFYHDGDFFSKDNITPGYATLHPRGIHHGPHPKALANQRSKTHTDEYAVMLDGLKKISVRCLPTGCRDSRVSPPAFWLGAPLRR